MSVNLTHQGGESPRTGSLPVFFVVRSRARRLPGMMEPTDVSANDGSGGLRPNRLQLVSSLVVAGGHSGR